MQTERRRVAAHYLCELAEHAVLQGDAARAQALLKQARAHAEELPSVQPPEVRNGPAQQRNQLGAGRGNVRRPVLGERVPGRHGLGIAIKAVITPTTSVGSCERTPSSH